MKAEVHSYHSRGFDIIINLEDVSESYADEICRGVQSYLDLIQELETDDG